MQRLRLYTPFVLMAATAFTLFALEQRLLGYGLGMLALALAFFHNRAMARDLALVFLGLFIVSLVPITTDISLEHMSIMALAMTGAVALPYLISRYVYKTYDVRFPFHFSEPWGKGKWLYLLLVLVVGYLFIPVYMISTGMYVNWPAAREAGEILRLFIGTNALGIWDELFFICITFTLFQKYLRFWIANLLQAVIFTSFLFELGFEGIGPIAIYLFALTQGYIFNKTHSLFYLICVHLLFDFILFLVLLHAHTREFVPLFFYW